MGLSHIHDRHHTTEHIILFLLLLTVVIIVDLECLLRVTIGLRDGLSTISWMLALQSAYVARKYSLWLFAWAVSRYSVRRQTWCGAPTDVARTRVNLADAARTIKNNFQWMKPGKARPILSLCRESGVGNFITYILYCSFGVILVSCHRAATMRHGIGSVALCSGGTN